MGLFGNEPRMHAYSLNEDDFKCLVRGGVLLVEENIKIALDDIGFDVMKKAIKLAEDGVDIYKDRDRMSNDGKGY